MNSPKSWLALAAALGSLALIAWQLPHSTPVSKPAPQTFDVMSMSISWNLEDDPPPLDDGQILGELRAPMASGSKRKPVAVESRARRKTDRDQTRADDVPERATIAG
jgi:hypothetical protein